MQNESQIYNIIFLIKLIIDVDVNQNKKARNNGISILLSA